MRNTHRVAATVVAAAAVGIGLASPAAAKTKPPPPNTTQPTTQTQRALKQAPTRGRLFERIEDAIDNAFHIPDPDDPPP